MKHDFRFRPTERLRAREEFLRVQTSGRKLSTANFILFIARAAGPSTRIGVTVSKKVGAAVRRNRVKRLIREAYRRNKARFPSGSDIVVVARPSAAKLSLAAVVAELEAALVKAGRR